VALDVGGGSVAQTFDGLQDRLGIFFFSFLFFGMTSLSSLGICT